MTNNLSNNTLFYAYSHCYQYSRLVEQQQFDIGNYTAKNNIIVEQWLENLKNVPENVSLVISDLSILGNNPTKITGMLAELKNKNIELILAKENKKLSDSKAYVKLISSINFVLEIQKNIKSLKSSEVIYEMNLSGKKNGRRYNSKNSLYKLSKFKDKIQEYLTENKSKTYIAQTLGVSRATLYRFIRENSNA
jgi:DNA invertase Pin-like site-specific DNA recombinase